MPSDSFQIVRFGKPNKPAGSRPLKITFANEEDASRFFFGVIKSNKSSQVLQNITVSKDRTWRERQYYKKLKDELRERIEQGEKDLVIKYVKDVPKIVSRSYKKN